MIAPTLAALGALCVMSNPLRTKRAAAKKRARKALLRSVATGQGGATLYRRGMFAKKIGVPQRILAAEGTRAVYGRQNRRKLEEHKNPRRRGVVVFKKGGRVQFGKAFIAREFEAFAGAAGTITQTRRHKYLAPYFLIKLDDGREVWAQRCDLGHAGPLKKDNPKRRNPGLPANWQHALTQARQDARRILGRPSQLGR